MRDDDARRVAEAIRRDFPGLKAPADPIFDAPPPLRVIDCVLSLNRAYETVVRPRIDAFGRRFPEVRTCRDLRTMMGGPELAAKFLADALDTRDARRAATLLGVVDYMLDVQQRFEGATETDRLTRWALWARPGDYLEVDVSGFALAGFQYLRILFGADTVKPDVHVMRYVAGAIGREGISDVHALYILERAAALSPMSLRDVDYAIWKRGARAS